MSLLRWFAIAACALVAAACGHQGISESLVRAQVRSFMSPAGADWKIVAVPSCVKTDRKDEWRCHVRVRAPLRAARVHAGHTLDLTVIASCTAKRCELARNDWTAYAPIDGAQWKAVINDWYNGGIDHPHSCAAVKVAMSHLPVDVYSNARSDLEAYERKVC